MRSIIALLFVITAFSACSDDTSKTPTDPVTTDTTGKTMITSSTDSTLQGCYSLISNKDTASLQLTVKGSDVTGTISYNLFEKDRNDGTFQGEIRDGKILGWYLFRSEGVMSVRQEAWMVKDDKLISGYGDTRMKNDSAYFADPSKLKYDSSRAFVKVTCVI